MKTVGNAAVASDSPSDSSAAARSGEGSAKILAANVKVATVVGAVGVTKVLPLGGGGRGGGCGVRLLIGAKVEFFGGISAAY